MGMEKKNKKKAEKSEVGEGIEEPDKAIRLIEGSITKIEDDLFLEYYLKY